MGRWVFVLWRGLSTLTSAPDQLQLMCPCYFMAPPAHLYTHKNTDTHTNTPIEIYIFLSHILGTSFGCYLTTWFLLRWILQRLLLDLASSWGGSQQRLLAHIRFAEDKSEGWGEVELINLQFVAVRRVYKQLVQLVTHAPVVHLEIELQLLLMLVCCCHNKVNFNETAAKWH